MLDLKSIFFIRVLSRYKPEIWCQTEIKFLKIQNCRKSKALHCLWKHQHFITYSSKKFHIKKTISWQLYLCHNKYQALCSDKSGAKYLLKRGKLIISIYLWTPYKNFFGPPPTIILLDLIFLLKITNIFFSLHGNVEIICISREI